MSNQGWVAAGAKPVRNSCVPNQRANWYATLGFTLLLLLLIALDAAKVIF